MKTLAPIILFVYNRPVHTQKVVYALQRNELATESDLFIYADGPKDCATKDELDRIGLVRQYIRTIKGFKSVKIVEQIKNKGLDPSEIDAISEIIVPYGKVIVLEDDVITHPFFLRFMNDALCFYEKCNNVFSVGSFVPPIPYLTKIKDSTFFSYRSESCGWSTWKDRWEKCVWDRDVFKDKCAVRLSNTYKIFKYNRAGGDIYDNLLDYISGNTDAWDARWQYCMFENGAVCIRPKYSLTTNIGFDGTGVHCGNVDLEKCGIKPIMYSENKYMFKFHHRVHVPIFLQMSMRNFYAYDKTPFYKKLKRNIKQFIMNVRR